MSGILIDSPKLATDEDMLHFLQLWPGSPDFSVRVRVVLHRCCRLEVPQADLYHC